MDFAERQVWNDSSASMSRFCDGITKLIWNDPAKLLKLCIDKDLFELFEVSGFQHIHCCQVFPQAGLKRINNFKKMHSTILLPFISVSLDFYLKPIFSCSE